MQHHLQSTKIPSDSHCCVYFFSDRTHIWEADHDLTDSRMISKSETLVRIFIFHFSPRIRNLREGGVFWLWLESEPTSTLWTLRFQSIPWAGLHSVSVISLFQHGSLFSGLLYFIPVACLLSSSRDESPRPGRPRHSHNQMTLRLINLNLLLLLLIRLFLLLFLVLTSTWLIVHQAQTHRNLRQCSHDLSNQHTALSSIHYFLTQNTELFGYSSSTGTHSLWYLVPQTNLEIYMLPRKN